eukprot:11831386-Alexandrium_andersonii.AAC.1
MRARWHILSLPRQFQPSWRPWPRPRMGQPRASPLSGGPSFSAGCHRPLHEWLGTSWAWTAGLGLRASRSSCGLEQPRLP